MTFVGWDRQILVFVAILVAVARPFGSYMARVYGDESFGRRRFGAGRARLPPPRRRRALSRTGRPTRAACVIFTLVFSGFLYLLLRLQGHLPLNPEGFKGVIPGVAANTTASFVTNTNWQFYARRDDDVEPQPDGRARRAELRLGGRRHGRPRRRDPRLLAPHGEDARQLLGRLLPVDRLHPRSRSRSSLALVLVSQGVVQTFSGHATATTLEGAEQQIARGPVASQIAIKHVGTNGGGFYNSNSAVPFESPTAFTSYFELFLELLIPVALVFMFGRMIGSMRQALGDLRRDVRALRRRRSRSSTRPSSTARRCCATPASTSRPATEQPGGNMAGQGDALRHRRVRRLRRRHDRHARPAR